MRFILLAVVSSCFVASALADGVPVPSTVPTSALTQSVVTDVDQSVAQSQSVGASVNHRSVGIGIANAQSSTPACPDGLVPGRGKSRGHSSPLYAISGICEPPDEKQKAAIVEAREHEVKLAELAVDAARYAADAAANEAARDSEAVRRIEAETQCVVCAGRK